MKLALIVASVLFVATSSEQKTDLGLPELHVIKTGTLSPSYSCRTHEEFQTGYRKTALFLSKYSEARHAPDLLFDGACGSEDEFQGSTAGDDMSLIADLGTVPLEEVSASKAFNYRRVHSFDLYSKFGQTAKVVPDHTYAVLINKREWRGLFVVSVTGYVPNQRVDLEYAVKEYQVLDVRAQAEGFDWSAKNSSPGNKK
jgi:hypothetical protein